MSEQQARKSTKDKPRKQDPVVKKKFEMKTAKFASDKSIERPKFEDDKNKGWIKYGKKNLFPDFLLDLYFKSGKHNSIINRKIKMIAGQGFEIEGNPEADAALKNVHGSHPGKKIAKLVASDQEIFKGFAVVVRWDAKKEKVAAFDYMPFHKVRKAIDKEGEEIGFLVSNDWSKVTKAENKPQFFNEFTGETGLSLEVRKMPKGTKEEKAKREEALRKELVEICYFQDVSVGTDAYPIPNYFSNVEWILTDSEIGKFSYNLAKKNFLGGFHIGFNNGIPEDDERQQAKKDFKEEYGGTTGEDIIVTFSEPESKGVDFNPLPSAGNEDIFENTEKRAQENIFIAHEVVNPVLFGIREPGQLGAKNELLESLEIFQAVYIDDRQENIEDVFTKILNAMGVDGEAKLKSYSLGDRNDNEQPSVELTVKTGGKK